MAIIYFIAFAISIIIFIYSVLIGKINIIIYSIIAAICFYTGCIVEACKTEKPKQKEIDYNIILLEPNSVEITDKHGNKDTIQFDSLQQYIELDNL